MEQADAMSRWALAQPDVKAVMAETLKENIASQRVLQKCGFILYREEGESLWWKLLSNN
ncbi:MAG: GNAT family N-acetyltransferase [Dysgonomonas sp.]|nr:GNAT family N-acetyltransferase [Dysgonomonas sp.]